MYQLILAGAGILGLNELVRYSMLQEDTDIQKPVEFVSIIMPAYNEEQYIGLALESIYNQEIIKQYPELFEVIVVDNNSTDNTNEIARRYTSNVIYEPRPGKLTARNTGISNSTGNIIVAVDSDRIYNNGWLNSLLKPFNDSSVVGVSGSNTDYDKGNPFMIMEPLAYYTMEMTYRNRMDGGNSSFIKKYFTKFNENINQFSFEEIINEEEIGLGEKLSQYGKIIYQINATSQHIGNDKTICRFNKTDTKDKECEVLGIGSQRF